MPSRIKLFQFNQKYNRAIGINSPELKNIVFEFNWKNLIFLVCVAQFITALTAFLFIEAKSMLDFGRTFYGIICLTLSVVIYINQIWNVKNCSKFIENCENLIEKRDRSTIEYYEFNEKIELFCKLFTICFPSSAMLMTISILTFSLVNYFIFNLGTESFYLIFPVVLPFDWKTPSGYVVAWLLQWAGGCTPYIIGTPFALLFFMSCWLFIFIADDITNDLPALNSDEVETNEKLKRFCHIIQLYSDAKQCMSQFNGIYKYALFGFFVWALFAVSCILLTIQFQLLDDNSKMIEIIMPLIFGLTVIGLLFLFCEPGERVSNHFEMFGEELERCDWYKFTIEMQRVYVTFLVNTQQPINIESYGGLQCTRETFKKVVTKGYSYFTAIRQLK